MRIPKTPIEFDYDLWTTEDGKCMVRVKSTGETSEVDREVMKLLRNEEKRLRRSMSGVPVAGSEDGEEATLLSLDYVSTDGGEGMSPAWLVDPHDAFAELEVRVLEEELLKALTPLQRRIYEDCIINGMTKTECARTLNMKRQSVDDALALIRKKAKKFF